MGLKKTVVKKSEGKKKKWGKKKTPFFLCALVREKGDSVLLCCARRSNARVRWRQQEKIILGEISTIFFKLPSCY